MKREPFKGKCNIAPSSGLRKRMRAARRGLPLNNPFVPLVPSEKAMARHAWYRIERAAAHLRAAN